MTTLNLGALRTPSFVGFERLFDELERSTKTGSSVYPPHNIIAYDNGKRFIIEIALAGYEENDIEILQDKNILTVRTVEGYTPAVPAKGSEYLHHGISAKRFVKLFTLAEGVKVGGAHIKNGLLSTNLYIEIPEADRPKRIKINGTRGDPQLLTE